VYFPEPTYNGLKMPLLWSAAMHTALFSAFLLAAIRAPRGESWGGAGGAGGAVSVGLVGSLPGVPLPRPDAVTKSRVVDETRGLHKEEAPQPRKTEELAKEIPAFEKSKAPKVFSRPSKVLEDKTLPPPGAIPYGQGGAPALPYTQFSVGGGSQGALNFGPGGGGDFAGRYPWYVEAVRRRISGNWLYSTVDPAVQWAPRAVVSFQVFRDGTIANIQLLRSSGNSSVDNSAIRAILSSSPLERLPNEYSGSYVMVEFWFDFRR
jgi:protein TonB